MATKRYCDICFKQVDYKLIFLNPAYCVSDVREICKECNDILDEQTGQIHRVLDNIKSSFFTRLVSNIRKKINGNVQ
jgi:hypothetical protein